MKKIFILLLVILIPAFCAAAYIYSTIFIKDLRAGRAEAMAEKYVVNLYSEYAVIGRNCQGEDTNNDSYVSCDLRIMKNEDASTEKVLNLQCPTMWKSYTGNTCKESRLAIPGQ